MTRSHQLLFGRYGAPVEPPHPLYPDILEDCERPGGAVTLVVVDMQPGYPAVNPRTIAGVVRQVKLAIANNWWVILLELKPYNNGSTCKEIADLLENYPRKIMWVKEGPDGSGLVQWSCEDFGYPSAFFRIVGVNTSACVSATICGLLRRYPRCQIRAIRQACNDEFEGMHARLEIPMGAQNVAMSSETIDTPAAD